MSKGAEPTRFARFSASQSVASSCKLKGSRLVRMVPETRDGVSQNDKCLYMSDAHITTKRKFHVSDIYTGRSKYLQDPGVLSIKTGEGHLVLSSICRRRRA